MWEKASQSLNKRFLPKITYSSSNCPIIASCLRADVGKYRPEEGKIKFLKKPPKIMYTPLGILVMKI